MYVYACFRAHFFEMCLLPARKNQSIVWKLTLTSEEAMQNSIAAQARMRRSAEEQSDFMKDLGDWEESIKEKDTELIRVGFKRPQLKQKDAGKDPGSFFSKKEGLVESAPPPCQINVGEKSFLSGSDSPQKHRNNAELVPTSKEPSEEEVRRRGNDRFGAGDYEAATRCYTRCLGINPKSAAAYSNRGE